MIHFLERNFPDNACQDQIKTRTTRRENSSSSSKHCLPITRFFILHRALCIAITCFYQQ